jgi:hypothetical protein
MHDVSRSYYDDSSPYSLVLTKPSVYQTELVANSSCHGFEMTFFIEIQ